MKRTTQELLELLRAVRELGYRRFRLEEDGLSLDVDSDPPASSQTDASANTASGSRSPGQPVTSGEMSSERAPASRDGLVAVTAPMTGTFYAAPEPGKPPFVKTGSHVAVDDVVCMIEVMKLFNSVRASVDGTVMDICKQNEDPVEAGEPIIWIKPD